jgi:hypothetical protein
MAINQFIGDKIIEKIIHQKYDSQAELIKLLSSDSEIGIGDWVDMAGLIAPKTEVEKLLNRISNEHLLLENIQKELNVLHLNYTEYSSNWAKNIVENQLGKPLNHFDIQDFITIIEKWKKSEITFNDLILRDAKKEFDLNSRTGFGLDGNNEQKAEDFENVRGNFENNPFVKEIKEKIESSILLANEVITSLEKIKK